ncbi:CRISPR-associated protein Cas5 [Cupriavidus necator]|uniref:CRISPR-associated protein Cas5 n=1 Tax=Cupriavidus necator TaxID=106590 RepID=UPI0014904E21|nr:CRISPR-associated protein Cas5 [Cupriavidus necator]
MQRSGVRSSFGPPEFFQASRKTLHTPEPSGCRGFLLGLVKAGMNGPRERAKFCTGRPGSMFRGHAPSQRSSDLDRPRS